MDVCMYAKQSYFATSSINEEPINNPKTQNIYIWAKIQKIQFWQEFRKKTWFFRKNQKNRMQHSATGFLFSWAVLNFSFLLGLDGSLSRALPCDDDWSWMGTSGSNSSSTSSGAGKSTGLVIFKLHSGCTSSDQKAFPLGGRDLPRSMATRLRASWAPNLRTHNSATGFLFFLSKKGLYELASLVNGVLQFTRLQPRLSTVPITCDYLTSKKEGACSPTQFEISVFKFLKFLDGQPPPKKTSLHVLVSPFLLSRIQRLRNMKIQKPKKNKTWTHFELSNFRIFEILDVQQTNKA